MPRLTNYEKDRILELSSKGYSSRDIAKEIFGDKYSRKSTINDFLLKNKISGSEFSNIKIAFLDIETAPSLSYHWQRYDVNIGQEQVVSESFILTYSVKYLGNNKVICGFLEPEDVRGEDDYRLTKELFEILNDVDVVVAHNGRAFDLKVINARLIYHGFPPPKPYKTIDTLLIARKYFKFPSNKLNDLCEYLGLTGKIETGGFKLWKGYMRGDEDAIDKMVEYNIQDVLILEQLYLKLRAWDTSHFNLNLLADEDVCPCCGSPAFDNVGKLAYTNVNAYETFRCINCGKIFKSRKKIENSKKIKYVNCI